MKPVTRQRLLLGVAILLMFIPTFLFAAGPLRQPPLFEGDRIAELDCRQCDATGKTQGEDCGLCRGRGKAQYILPGPNRPQQVIGTVVNAGGHPVESARVSVMAGPDQLEFQTNHEGQFGVKLPPGDYTIAVRKEEVGQSEQSFVVPVTTQPLPAANPTTLQELPLDFELHH